MPAPLVFQSQVTLAAPPDTVWRYLTEPALVAQYHLAPLHMLELRPGGRLVYGTEIDHLITGEVLEFETTQKLVHTFRFGPASHQATVSDPDSVVNYLLTAGDQPGTTLLTLRHEGFPEENQTYANIRGGWPHILDNLAGLLILETG